MPNLLEWAAMAPWPSVNDLAGFSGVNRSTVSRQLTGWLDQGLVVVRNDGRLLRPRNRLLVSSGGLAEVFPERHVHPFEGEHHDHHPFHPEWEDHAHPQYYNGYAGAELLYSRLECIEIAYPLAPVALMGNGARWTRDGRPRRLLSWRWLRHTRLINAVATYEDGYRLFYCWVGSSVTVPMLRWRYQHRFDRFWALEMSSGAEEMDRGRDPLITPPDPDFDSSPQPSAWVIISQDQKGAEIAEEVLPRSEYMRANAFLFAIGTEGGPRIYVGRAEPAPWDDVGDKAEDVNIGIPEDLCR